MKQLPALSNPVLGATMNNEFIRWRKRAHLWSGRAMRNINPISMGSTLGRSRGLGVKERIHAITVGMAEEK